MKLRKITDRLKDSVTSGEHEIEITSVTSDSRKVEPGMVYVAIKGGTLNGEDFISDAIDNGAVAIIAERAPTKDWTSAAWVHVKDARYALAVAASECAGDPSKKFKLIGVTGTNGKTTTTFMMHHILREVHLRAGLMGTIKCHDGVTDVAMANTTPDPVLLNEYLKEMADNGCRSVAMEVSSHGISQQRVASLDFDVLVFTNLSQDHLDYHGDMENYFQAKRQWFVDAAASSKKIKAVINIDDSYGARLAKEFAEKLDVFTYGQGVHAQYRFGAIKQSIRGSGFELHVKGKSYLVRLPMIGRFNVYNAVAAIAGCVAAGVSPRSTIRTLADMPQVPGRLELVEQKMGMSVFVDYAHTPDAITSVGKALRELDPKRIITVFGCGGDRDAFKRPLMAQAAGEVSDLCFITSDNPRSEDPEAIIAQVEAGMRGCTSRSIVDREEAIKTAVAIASGGDIVLIAGKGHEDYQIFADETIPFDDRIKARAALREFKVSNMELEKEERDARPARDSRPPREDGAPRRDDARPARDDRAPRRENSSDRDPRPPRENRDNDRNRD